MIVDLNLKGKRVVVVGGGRETERKTKMFLDAGANVVVMDKKFSAALRDLSKRRTVRLVKCDVSKDPSRVAKEGREAAAIVISNDDERTIEKVLREVRDGRALIYIIDYPELSDFIQPSLTVVKNIQVAVSTGGKSPVMARNLSRRLARSVTQEDVLHVELQEYSRNFAKGLIKDAAKRGKLLYEMSKNGTIARLLRQEKLDEAKDFVRRIIAKEAR